MARSHFFTRIFALLSLSIGITQLNCACGAKCSEEINGTAGAVSEQSGGDADFWKHKTKDIVEFGQAVLQNIPGWSAAVRDVLLRATQKTLSADSEEFRAIKKLSEIVGTQFNETISRLDHVSDKAKLEILASDYDNRVETILIHLRHSNRYMLADFGTPQQITSTLAFLNLCRQYLPWRLVANMRSIIETCTEAGRQNRFAGTRNGKVQQADRSSQACMLALAYKHQDCPSASLYNVVNTFLSHSTELVMYGYMCATLEYGENGIYSSDFRQVVEHARETNAQMLMWVDRRMEKAWNDEMPKKAEAILRRSEENEIPKEEYQKVAESIRESMDLMGPQEYRHNVFLVGLSLSTPSPAAVESRSVRYVYAGYPSVLLFSVKNVKGVDVVVSRYKVGDAKRARASFQLMSSRLSEAQKLVDESRDLLVSSERVSAIIADHFYQHAYNTLVQIYIRTLEQAKHRTCEDVSERSEFVFAAGTIASPLCAGGKCPTHYEVTSTPGRRNAPFDSQIRCSYLLLFL